MFKQQGPLLPLPVKPMQLLHYLNVFFPVCIKVGAYLAGALTAGAGAGVTALTGISALVTAITALAL